MKELLIWICILSLLFTYCYAKNNNNPLGLYSMMDDFVGIGMNRASIEKVLGEALNEPFPEPVFYSLSFSDYDVCGWPGHSPLTEPSRGYYC